MTSMNGLLTPVAVIRNSISAVTQILSGRNITVHQRGLSAHVAYSEKTGEPTSVSLPYLPDDASEDLILAVQGFLDHEVGHLLFTDNKLLMDIAHDGSWLHMQNVLEDPYVERQMQARFPGSKSTILRLHTFFIEKMIEPNFDALIKSGEVNPLAYFGTLLPCITRAWHGFSAFEDYMKDKWVHFEPITAKLPDDVAKQVRAVKCSADNIALARVLIDAIMRVPASEEFDDLERDEGDEGAESEGESGGGKRRPGGSEGEPGTGHGDSSAVDPSRTLIDEEGDHADEPRESGELEDEHEAEPEESESPRLSGDVHDEEGDEEEEIDEEGEAGGTEEDPLELDDMPAFEEHDEEEEDGAGEAEFDPEYVGGEEGEDGMVDGDIDEKALADRTSGKPKESEEPEDDGDEKVAKSEWVPKDGETPLDYSPGDIETTLGGAIADMAKESASSASYIIYSTDHDKIEPYKTAKMGEKAEQGLPLLERITKSQVGVMQGQLQRALISKSKSYWRGAQQSGRIDPSSLSRLYVGDTRVFRKKVEHRSMNYDVSLLIDASGSMGHPAGEADGVHLNRFQAAMVAAYAMGDTLNRLGINFEIIGFTTYRHTSEWSETCSKEMSKHGIRFGRTDWLYMPIFKSFDERWGSKSIERIAAAFHHHDFLSQNVDGECVQIAAQRLAQQRSEGKLLMVLSDGMPACCSPDPVSLTRHLAKSVKSVEQTGIKVIGVGINTDAVTKFYTHNIVLRDVSKLPTELVDQVQRVLLS